MRMPLYETYVIRQSTFLSFGCCLVAKRPGQTVNFSSIHLASMMISFFHLLQGSGSVNWHKISTQSYELAEECLTINYYGAKRMVQAFVPLLQLSDSPRIVNVSSSMGKLKVKTLSQFATGNLFS